MTKQDYIHKITNGLVCSQAWWGELEKMKLGWQGGWSQHDEFHWDEKKLNKMDEQKLKHIYEHYILGKFEEDYPAFKEGVDYRADVVLRMPDGHLAMAYLGTLIRIPQGITTFDEMWNYCHKLRKGEGRRPDTYCYDYKIHDSDFFHEYREQFLKMNTSDRL